ncbi:MAG: tetratricopeptide repeat protein [Vicinamibacterales bacterium]
MSPRPARGASRHAPPPIGDRPLPAADGRRLPWRWLALVAGLAFALRAWHLWQMRATPFFTVLMGDARGYDQWAARLAAGDWIGSDVFYQAPLYPYFLGVVYAVAGHDLMAVRVVQAAVGAASAALIAAAGARLFSPRVGLVAGLMLAAYAPAIFFDGLIQKTVLDVAFVSAATATLAALLAGSHDRRGLWAGLGAVIAALSLTRENALLLVAVIAVWIWRGAPRGRLGRRAALAWFAAGVAIVLAPVAARNYAVSGGLYLTTSQFGPNFYIGNHAGADGSYVALRFGRGSPEYERLDATELAERAEGRPLTPAEVSRHWTRRALAFIAAEPGRWLLLQARKAWLLVSATEMIDTEAQESHAEWSWPLRILGPVAHFGVLVPLAVLGLWFTWPERRRLWVFHAVIATVAATTLAFYVFARYRFPLVPVLVVFAAAALVRLADHWRGWSWPERARVAGVAVAVAVPCWWPVAAAARARAITEVNLGAALHDDGRLEEAAARYRRALEIAPDYVPAVNNLGVTLKAMGRLDEAIALYRDGLRLRDDYPDLHFNLANALLAADRREEAAAHFRLASAGEPDSVGAHNNLGTALAEQGRLAEAAAAFERAVTVDPTSARAHRNLGNALAGLGRRDQGLTHLRRAVELTPADAEAHYDLGVFMLEDDRLDEAVAAFTAAIAARPGYAEAHNNLGIALGSQGHFDQAIAQFETALRLAPDLADAAENLETARRARQVR